MAYSFGPRPNIVTSGMVLHLDAGNTSSYPGSGTTWTDLSGQGNNATLNNGPTFDSANGGSIVFDGTNDYALVTNPSTLQVQNLTVSVWIKPRTQIVSIVSAIDFDHSTIPYRGWVMQSEDANTDRRYYFAWTDGSQFQPVGGFGSGIGIQLTNNVWQNITYTKNGTTLIGYTNGVSVFSPVNASNATISYTSGRNLAIAANIAIPDRCFNGEYGIVQVYNRALSDKEVFQNYYALKSRFEL